MSQKQRRQLARKAAIAVRKPISLDLNTAIGSLLTASVQTDAVKIALSVICDERHLEGAWAIQVTGAQLVPIPDKPPPTEGA